GIAGVVSDGAADRTGSGEPAASAPGASADAVDPDSLAYVVRGRVVDPQRRPIPGAEVLLFFSGADTGASRGASGADGRFAVGTSERRPRGSWLRASAAGYAPSLLDGIYMPAADIDVGPIVLWPGASISGRVVDPDGRPVAGASIFLSSTRERREGEDTYAPIATTSAEGAYQASGLPSGRADLGIAAAGWSDAVQPGIRLRSDGPNVFDVTLRAEEPLAGTVVDDVGDPVAAARVRVTRSDAYSFWKKAIETDEAGAFATRGLSGERRRINVSISKVGHESLGLQGNQLPADDRYVLKRVGGLVVTAERETAPAPTIRSVALEWRNEGDGRWYTNWLDATNEQRDVIAPNVWRVGVWPGQTVRVAVVSADGWLGRSSEMEPPATGQTREVSVALEAPATVTGKVLGPDLAPLAGAFVEIASGDGRSGPVRRVRSAEDGSFRAGAVPPGPVQLWVRSKEWTSASISLVVTPGETRENLELRALAAGRIVGRITVAGAPPGEEIPIQCGPLDAAARRQAGGPATFVAAAAADGTFAIAPLAAGRYGLSPKRLLDADAGALRRFNEEFPSAGPRNSKWTVDVAAGSEAHIDIDLPAPRAMGIRGRVVVNGDPRAGVYVSAWAIDGGGWRNDRTDADGRFRLVVDRGGVFQLQANASGVSEQRRVTVPEGDEVEVSLELSVGSVEGFVADLDGRGVAMRVQLRRENSGAQTEERASWGESPEGIAREDGRYAFAEVPAGTYRVVSRDRSHAFATVAGPPFTVQARERVVAPDLRVPRAVSLVVQSLAPDGAAVRGLVHVVAAEGEAPLAHPFRGQIGRSGAVRIRGLPPRKVLITFQPFGRWKAAPLAVDLADKAGEIARIALEATDTATREENEGEYWFEDDGTFTAVDAQR
ncbi:MAG TPA: carboxypeptidase-like regulatory domain-containing protein, partial [Planctomycetota bacterium]|nr:carboxypeptidase-like regulatory domain-containing protein [Planctomycetota bacterium]